MALCMLAPGGAETPGRSDVLPSRSPWAGCVHQTLVLREVRGSDLSVRALLLNSFKILGTSLFIFHERRYNFVGSVRTKSNE